MCVWKSATCFGALLATTLSAEAGETSIRPELRPDMRVQMFEPVSEADKTQSFQGWIKGFKQRALQVGISQQTLDQAFQGVRYDPNVIKRDRNQSEFTKTIWDYLDSAASDLRVSNGKVALGEHQSKLDAIEEKYDVDKDVIVAIWGLESAYGTCSGVATTLCSLWRL